MGGSAFGVFELPWPGLRTPVERRFEHRETRRESAVLCELRRMHMYISTDVRDRMSDGDNAEAARRCNDLFSGMQMLPALF